MNSAPRAGAPLADAPVADKAALARLGASVRKRLAADPSVHRVPIDQAEIFVVGGFLSPEECAHLMAMIDRTREIIANDEVKLGRAPK